MLPLVFNTSGGAGAVSASVPVSQDAATSTLTPTPTSLADLAAAGGNQSLTLRTSGGATSWSLDASSVPSWMTVMPSSGSVATVGTAEDFSLTLTINPNAAGARNATLVFNTSGGAGAVSASVPVSQDAATSTLTPTPTSLADLDAAGGNQSLSLRTGGGATSWSLDASSVPSWMTVMPSSGTIATVGTAEDFSLTLTINPNAAGARNATLVFNTSGGAGAVSASVPVSQDAATSTLTPTPTSLADLDAAGGNQSLTLRTGGGATAWALDASSVPSWMTVMPSGGSVATVGTAEDFSLTLTINPNAAGARNATLVFNTSGGAGAVSASVLVSQDAATSTLTPTPTSLADLSAAGGNQSLSLRTSGGATSWSLDASSVPSWMTVMPSSGSVATVGTAEDFNLTLTINPNAAGARNATLIFNTSGGSGAVSASVPVSQDAAAPTLVATPTSLADLDAAGGNQSLSLRTGGGATAWVLNEAFLPDWIEVSPNNASVATVGTAETFTLSVRVGANAGEPRTGTLIFNAVGGTGSASASVPVSQNAVPPTLTLRPTSLALPVEGGMRDVNLGVSGGTARWNALISPAASHWISLQQTGTAPGVVTLNIRPNTGIARQESILFVVQGGAQEDGIMLEITQVGSSTHRTYYATPMGAGSMDGSSWENANTLHGALAVMGSGNELWVRHGTYTPTDSSGTTPTDPRNASYEIPNGARIYGGFIGTEISLEERNIAANLSIIEGNIGETEDATDNIKRLLVVHDTAALNELTLQHAYATGSAGGALYAAEAHLDIRRCKFLNNRAASGGAVGLNGSTASIENCLFVDNTAQNEGGAIALTNASNLSMYQSTFFQNTADRGGLIHIGATTEMLGAESIPEVRILNCLLWDNRAREGQHTFVLAGNRVGLDQNLVSPRGDNAFVTHEDAMYLEQNPIPADATLMPTNIFASLEPTEDNYMHLATNSPASNAGNNDYMDGNSLPYATRDEAGLLDLAGNARLAGENVDAGAFESGSFRPAFIRISTLPVRLDNLPATGGMLRAVPRLGGSATGWRVRAMPNFVRLSAQNGTSNEAINITYEVNLNNASRLGEIIIQTTGGEAMAVSDTIRLGQRGAEGLAVLRAITAPEDLSTLPATAIVLHFMYVLAARPQDGRLEKCLILSCLQPSVEKEMTPLSFATKLT